MTDAVRAPARDLPAREATAREAPASPRVSSGAYRRGLAIVAAAVLALGLALGLGEAWGRHGRSAAAALPVASPSASRSATASAAAAPTPAGRWVSVVQRLATTRSQAFDRADPSLLTSVYLAGTAAYDTDLATVRSLAGRGLRAKGFAATVDQVTVERADGSAARLHVVDRLSGYTLVDAAGAVHGRGDARPARGYTMSLRRTGSGWRITTLTPA